MAARLRLGLFGQFRLELDGQPVCERLARRTYPRRVLQFLASTPAMVETRSALASALWPGDQTDKLPNRLHQAIHFLRGELNLIPETVRPLILVDHDRVSLQLPAGVECDALQFYRLLAYDDVNPEARLNVLLEAASLARDEFASDWTDAHEIGLRQIRFRRELTQALREAAQIAEDLGNHETCLRAGEQLCQLELASIDDHLEHARRLSTAGRPDAAIAHCQQALASGNLPGPQAREQLDEFIRQIQRSTNNHGIALPTHQSGRRQHAEPVKAPITRAIGYQDTMRSCISALKSPYSRILTIAGAPGAGKTTIAREIAFEVQKQFEHGVVMLDAYRLDNLRSLMTELANALDLPVTECLTTIRDRKLLIVVDGVEGFQIWLPALVN